MIVDQLMAVLGFQYQGDGDLRRFQNGLKNAEDQTNRFVGSIGKMALAIGGAFAAIGGAQAVGRGLSTFISDVTATGSTFEQLGIRLKTLEGSAAAGEKAMEWIRDFAQRTPLDLESVADSYARLRSLGIDPTNGSMQAITDTMAAMGGGVDRLNGMILALGQAWTKGKLQGDEVMQLNERGIPVWDLLAEATGRNVAELQDLSAAGKLGRTEITLLIEAMGRRYYGASEEFSRSFAGITERLRENWTNFLKAVADAGYYEDIKRRLSDLHLWVERQWDSGFLGQLAERVSRGIVGTMNVTTHLATQAYRIGRGFYYAADGAADLVSRMTGLSKGMAAMGMGAGLVASSTFGRAALLAIAKRFPMVAAALLADDLIGGLNGDDSLVGSTPEGQAALEGMRKNLSDMKAAAESAADAIGNLFGITRGEGESAIQSLGRSLRQGLLEGMVRAVQDITQGIQDLTASLQFIESVLKDPSAAWERFVNAAIQQIDRLIEAIDAKLGGALTRYGLIGNGAVAQDNPNAGVRGTGVTTSAPRAKVAYEPDASLVRDGMVNAEGLRVQYGVSEDSSVAAATTIANIMASISSFRGAAEAVLKVDEFVNPGNQALAIQADLERGINATATLNVEQWLINAQRAKAALNDLNAAGAAKIGSLGFPGPSPMPARGVAN